MAFSMPPRFRGSALFGAVIATLAMAAQPALALDFLGWFGLGEKPPAPSATTITYEVQFPGVTDKDLLQALRDASTLYRLRQDPLPDAESLLRRSQVDLPHLTSALWGAGYYDGTVSIAVGGMPLGPDGTDARILRRIEAYRGVAAVPISVITNPGPLFSIGRVVVNDARTNAPFAPQVLPQRVIKLRPGDPARSALVVAAEARIIDHFRNVGHPFAKVVHLDPVVDHRSKTMSLAFSHRSGAGRRHRRRDRARDENASIRPSSAPSSTPQPGDPYSPRRSPTSASPSAASRRSARCACAKRRPSTPPGTCRSSSTSPSGRRASSASRPRYSTIDGPGVRAYWAHRNLFGGAERLRFEADLYYAHRADRFVSRRSRKNGDFDWSDLGGRFRRASSSRRSGARRNDLLVDGSVARGGDATAIPPRSPTAPSRSGTASATRSRSRAASRPSAARRATCSGDVDYTLVGLPLSVTYDSTDNPLDPTRGVRLTASRRALSDFLGSDRGMLRDARRQREHLLRLRRGRALHPRRPRRLRLDRRAPTSTRSRRTAASMPAAAARCAATSIRRSAPARPLRRADRRPQPARRLARGAHQGDRHDRHRALRRCRHGLRVELSRFRRARSASRPASACATTPASARSASTSPFPLDRRKGDQPVALYIGLGQAF